MPDNVIPFGKQAEEPEVDTSNLAYVCHCGCSSWQACGDGNLRCASCGGVLDEVEGGVSYRGGWYDKVKNGPMAVPPDSGTFDVVHDLGLTSDFAKRRTARAITEEDAVYALVLTADGSIKTWTCVSTGEQLQWVRRKLRYARQMVTSMVVAARTGNKRKGGGK